MNRKDFIILDQKIYDRPLVYFDNAATTQKPEIVINAMSDYYRTINSNIHRGVHYLSQRATDQFEIARQRVRAFINAANNHEIIFTRGTTEAINLVASSFGKAFLCAGDEVIITEMEHHANIVPWQMICEERGAKVKALSFDSRGVLEAEKLESLITEKTKIVSIAHISNALGTINPIKQIIEIAHRHDIPVMVDGAQAISHAKVDVQELDCDFYCFSGHKMYGPMGIGVLYGKEKWLDKMPPYQGGGEMIKKVTIEKTTYADLPFKFEAGTPAVGDAIGLEKAIEYMENIGIEKIANHEEELLQYGVAKMQELGGIDFVGTAPDKTAIISFNFKGIHPYDAGVIIDRMGVAVRTGHHCAQPVMDHFGIPGTIRASFALYNEKWEIDMLIEALKKVKMMFG
ncbi:cysteine desulfurase [Bacteroidales bacterium OttesenSCG-928-B11]|nr:cysteine desulfurase [Bacteroidales bacterium OttesenSCG-928-B11]MDL2326997.1 cysteine desulfurase [Bacteroidales bacterium OttesenSCG-928-A14]